MEQPDSTTPRRAVAIEAVEWLPSGDDSDLVRVRGRAGDAVGALPELVVGGQRFVSLPDPRAGRDPRVWRGAYLVPAGLFPPQDWWLEWTDGARTALPEPSHGLGVPEPPPLPGVAPPPGAAAEATGGEVVERAVLAERRARRAEAAEQAQARIAAQALKAVELMELRAAELERALEAVSAERNELLGRGAAEAELRSRLAQAQARVAELEAGAAAAPSAAELAAALEAAARTRAQARDWRLHLRVAEIARTSAAVRLAVLEASLPEAARLRTALAERERELREARALAEGAAAAHAALEAERDRRVSAQLELEAARGELAALRADAARLLEAQASLADARADAARAHVALRIAETSARTETVARAALGEELNRTRAELERLRRGLTPPAPAGDLARAAAEQVAAARAAASEPTPDLAADLDAAAEALRNRTPPPEPDSPAPPAPPVAEAAAPPAAEAGPTAPPADDRARDGAPIPSPRGDDLPWLRGALVRMAHEDPEAAARLIVGLLPAQAALVAHPLEYDLTIRGLGTYAASVDEGRAEIRPVPRHRSRRQTDFHLTGDAAALAEMLAGRQREVGRFSRRARVRGRNPNRLADLWLAAQAPFSLAGAARAGARLEPDAVFRAFTHAIDPRWTRGHAFTVAQEVVGEGTWYVTVADGAPVRVTSTRPATPPRARVTMSRGTFDALLRREVPPPGERPAIRGDRRAVDLLRTWTDRAQGLD